MLKLLLCLAGFEDKRRLVLVLVVPLLLRQCLLLTSLRWSLASCLGLLGTSASVIGAKAISGTAGVLLPTTDDKLWILLIRRSVSHHHRRIKRTIMLCLLTHVLRFGIL